MNYFQILGLTFGFFAFLKPFYMHIIPWDENSFIAKAYPKKRPAWAVAAAIIGLSLIAYTWYKEFTTDFKYSIVISVLFSLSGIKAILLILDYKRFYLLVTKMLSKDKGRTIVILDLFVGLFGLLLIIISLFLL